MTKKQFHLLMLLGILGTFCGLYIHKQAENKKLKILFIGNSLTQDAVSYVPMILKNIAPEVNFKIYDWYCGGYTAKQHIDDWNNGKIAQTLSVADNSFKWKNYYSFDFFTEKIQHATKGIIAKLSSSKVKSTPTLQHSQEKQDSKIPSMSSRWENHYISGISTSHISDLLKKEKFDIIVVQEYFNNMKRNYTKEDFDGFKRMLNHIKEQAPYSFYLATLFHAPHRTVKLANGGWDMDNIYHFSKKSTQKILQETEVDGVIPVGEAMYSACHSELNILGDKGGLSSDTLHSQEGLPCMVMAYVTTQWILDKLNINKTILGDRTRITTQNYPSIKVPGANLGSGVIEGSEQQYSLIQRLALDAIEKGKKLEESAHKKGKNEKRFLQIKQRVLE